MTCFIIPPYILKHIALSADASPEQREWAIEELARAREVRAQRRVLSAIMLAAAVPAGTKRRTVYDAGHGQKLPGILRRGENDPATRDGAVNRAFDYAGATFDFYQTIYQRMSVDDRGMRLDSSVHFGENYANAFWNGAQMVYGDGDGDLFGDFTKCLDVVAHEMTHGVTQFEANLDYQDQSGALNESFSDVFGVCVKQWKAGTPADKADWLVGDGIFVPPKKGSRARRDAIRSMENPGTAYDDPLIGQDPQVGHMKDYVKTSDDDGGVHINSGIPNRAFCIAAKTLGGNAWDVAGHVWYITLRDRLRPAANFQDCAQATIAVARELYGEKVAGTVSDAWKTVGVKVPKKK